MNEIGETSDSTLLVEPDKHIMKNDKLLHSLHLGLGTKSHPALGLG